MPDDLARLEQGVLEEASDRRDEKAEAEANAIATLSNEIETLKDARAEERFLWVVVTITLFDSIIFDKMQSWSGPIVIGIIQLVLLTVAARRLGVQEVSQILAKFLDRAADYTQGQPRPPA